MRASFVLKITAIPSLLIGFYELISNGDYFWEWITCFAIMAICGALESIAEALTERKEL